MQSFRLESHPKSSPERSLSHQEPVTPARRTMVDAVRDVFKKGFTKSSQSLDRFELLNEDIAKAEHKALLLGHLSNDYSRLKSRPGSEITQCLISHHTFKSFVPYPMGECERLVHKSESFENVLTGTRF